MMTLSLLLAAAAVAHAQDFTWPVSGSYTQGFFDTFSGKDAGTYYDQDNAQQYFAGYNTTGTKLHRAIDIGCATGTAVRAPRAGTVTTHGSTSHFYGYYVIVDHGSGYYSLCAHLSSFAVSSGTSVSGGQVIAYSGATGNVTGPHVHFEIRHTGNSSWYAPNAHYIPGGTISAGASIAFDYPGIGGASPPAMPVLYSPTPGAALPAGTVTLDWADVSGADYYYVAVYKSGSLVFQDWPTSSASWPSLGAGSYSWSVYAHNATGYGPGATSSFTVGGSSPPAAPAIYSPAGGATLSSATVTLDWSDVAAIDYYYVAAYKSGSLVYEAWPTSSSAVATLSAGSFTWSVYAHNAAGYGPGASSSFTIVAGSTPGTPTGLTPDGWATISTASVTLDWSTVAGATSYEVSILYWNGSGWVNYHTYIPTASAQTFWPAVHFTYYAWQVRAKNGSGAGAWSPWAYFYFNK
jgi:hypothetical protein